jgi:hypothetical protein
MSPNDALAPGAALTRDQMVLDLLAKSIDSPDPLPRDALADDIVTDALSRVVPPSRVTPMTPRRYSVNSKASVR